MDNLTYDEQVKATNTIIEATLLMYEYGAESILIEQTSQRLGRAFKIDSVELALVSAAIVMTTFTNNRRQSVSTTRRTHEKSINMSVVCDIQKIIKEVEDKNLKVDSVLEAIQNITPQRIRIDCDRGTIHDLIHG